MVDKVIRIRLDASQANRDINQLDSGMRRAGGAADGLQTALTRVAAAVAAAFSVAKIIAYADAFTGLQNQLRIVTTSTENLNAVSNELLKIANESRSSFASSADLYSKLARSTEELGISQERLLRVTETINKSFAAAGSTAEQAAGSILQLGQGLAAGALRGDEFNSVAEGAPGILRAVAVETGKTIGELREFAAQGGITSELLIRSIENYADVVNSEFASTSRTFGQSIVVANNNLTDFIGRSNAVQSSLRGLGDVLVGITGSLDEFDKFGTALAAGFTKIAISAEGQFRLLGEGIELALTLPFFEARNAAVEFITFLINLGEPVRSALGFDGIFDGFTASLAQNRRDVLAEYKQITDGIKSETELALAQADEIYADIFAGIGVTSGDAIEKVKGVNGELKEIVITFEQLKKVSSGIDALFSGGFNLFGDDGGSQSDESAARINGRIADLRQETATISSELALQQAARDGFISQEQAALDLQTATKIQRAITERELLLAEKGITYEQQLAAETAFQDQMAVIAQQYSALNTDNNAIFTETVRQANESVVNSNIQTAGAGLSILESFVGRNNKLLKVARLALGAFSAYTVYAQSSAAAAAALAPPPIGAGPIFGKPLAAAIMAAGKASAAGVLAGAVGSAFSNGGGGGGGLGSFGGGGSAATAPLPTTPTSAPLVGSVEITGLQSLTDELRNSDAQLPATYVAKILDAVQSANRLRGEG